MENYLIMLPDIPFPEEEFDLFLDVGLSYNAPHSQEVLKANPKAFVIGVEPNPNSCSRVRSLNLGDRFYLVEAGAGDIEEIKAFNIIASEGGTSSDEGTSSFLDINDCFIKKGCSVKQKITVKVIPLKVILDMVPWDRVSNNLFDMKSDTQGYEDKVIKGIGGYISKIRNLQIESTTWGDYKNASDHEVVRDLLSGYMNEIANLGGNAWFKRK